MSDQPAQTCPTCGRVWVDDLGEPSSNGRTPEMQVRSTRAAWQGVARREQQPLTVAGVDAGADVGAARAIYDEFCAVMATRSKP